MATFCFASYEIHPTTWGGAGVLIHHVARELIAAGHDVVLLLDMPSRFFHQFDRRDRAAYFHEQRCRAYSVDRLCEDLAIERTEVDSLFVWQSLRFAHALERLLRRESVDYVEFFEYCGAACCALAGAFFAERPGPALGVRVHNTVELIDRHEATKAIDRDRYLLYALERRSLDWAHTLLVPSEPYAEAYCGSVYGVAGPRVVEAPPPVAPFPRVARAVPAQRDEIVFYGRIFEFKGVERFVAAGLELLDRRPDAAVRFALIGPDSRDSPAGGSYTAYLRRRIPERLLDRFVFTGHLDHPEVARRLERALFAVFPNRFESFCYALHEIRDAGIPILASDIPAFRHALRDGEDALFFGDGIGELVRAMERLLDDSGLRERLAAAPVRERPPIEPIYADLARRPPARTTQPPRVVNLVVVPNECPAALRAATIASGAAALRPGDVQWVACESESGASRLLGREVQFETPDGDPVPHAKALTAEALWVLLAGDQPAAEFLDGCRRALARGPDLAFAGAWTRDANGRLDTPLLDIAPELYPLERGGRLTRAVLRTPAGIPIDELFEPRLECYGEIGWVWKAVSRWGFGALAPAVGCARSPLDEDPLDPVALAFLLANDGDGERARRLALWNAARPPARRPASPVVGTRLEAGPAQAARLADEYLNGRTLLKLAVRKLGGKLSAPWRRFARPACER